jgi:hypothetical protein
MFTQWWAHLVGARRVLPHKHDANYPPQKDRGSARLARAGVHPRSRGPRWGSALPDDAPRSILGAALRYTLRRLTRRQPAATHHRIRQPSSEGRFGVPSVAFAEESDLAREAAAPRSLPPLHYPFSSVDPSEVLPARSRSNGIASNSAAAAACPCLSITKVTQLLMGTMWCATANPWARTWSCSALVRRTSTMPLEWTCPNSTR